MMAVLNALTMDAGLVIIGSVAFAAAFVGFLLGEQNQCNKG